MKKALPYLYLSGALLMPTAYALAQGDGHTDHAHGAPEVADPSSRTTVMIVVGIFFALMVGWFIWAKMKNAPSATTGGETPPNTSLTDTGPHQ